jgi:threonine dehydrogenase-like Zn-dependent dehydrogenase
MKIPMLLFSLLKEFLLGGFSMKARAVRLHGANDLRLDEFELPAIKDDEILVKIVSDSICMSTYKCAILGEKHKRVHPDVAEHPAITGHEFAGDIIRVGAKYKDKFKPGMKFTTQPALNYKGTMWSPGYSYEFFGGDTTYCVIPPEVMEVGCLLNYHGDAYYKASLAEPMSCCIGAFHACFHTKRGSYDYSMGVKKDGKLALVAAAGPMGLGALAYALHIANHPSLIVMTDINDERLARAQKLFPKEETDALGISVKFLNTKGMDDASATALVRSFSSEGYDDVFCFAPIASVVALSSDILGKDGCLNFFAGPTDKQFHAPINFYDVHYNSTHVIGTTGGNIDDMMESLRMTEQGTLDPSVMVTHIGGLNCAAETTLHLPQIPGGKKLIYTHIEMPLVAIDDFRKLSAEDARFGALADITDKHHGLWCTEAENYLLAHWPQKA